VRLDGARVADARGPWPALGTTLFWAMWGEKHDPDRLDKNLAFAARHGVDYIRVLSMVGTETWVDRVIDPQWPDYWDVVDRLVARAQRHGLRLQVTIFADAQVMMPLQADREAWIDAWAAQASKTPERFFLLEVANEYWQNGFASAQAVGVLGARLTKATTVLVAPSAPQCPYPASVNSSEDRVCVAEWRALHADGVIAVATPHLSRDRQGPFGARTPACDPFTMRHVPQDVARTFVSNEPIGPQSSVAAEGDPGRLAEAALNTWLAGGAAYTLHTGAGIRGGGRFDRDRGRSANLWEVPRIEEILAALRRAQAEGATDQMRDDACRTL
jgi:hypothetical protein